MKTASELMKKKEIFCVHEIYFSFFLTTAKRKKLFTIISGLLLIDIQTKQHTAAKKRDFVKMSACRWIDLPITDYHLNI